MLFGEPTKVAPDPVPSVDPDLAPDPELVEAKLALRDELSRADRAIRAAMGHADEIFLAPAGYRGPEHRRVPR